MRQLLIRPGGIGDCILSFPALDFLRRQATYTEVWTRTEIVPLVQRADTVLPIASTGLDLLGVPGVDPPESLLLRLRNFDRIVSWYGANREEFRGAAERLKLPIRFHAALPPLDSNLHAADFFLAQAGGSGHARPRILCEPDPNGAVWIHPFSGSSNKNWPLERFRELARRLALPIAWTAGPGERLEGARRFDNLLDLARSLAGARLYIGNDSGITHLAASVGTPVTAIFGPTDPRVWAPRGDRVRIAAGQLDSLDVEEVLRHVCDLLQNG